MRLLLFALAAALAAAQQPPTISSAFTPGAVEMSPDPAAPVWRDAVPVIVETTATGEPAPVYHTEIRTRWDGENLHVLFACSYDRIKLNPAPRPQTESHGVWDWDAAEIMIGADFSNIENYVEFGFTPTDDWYDFDRGKPEERGGGFSWNSHCKVKSRIDRDAKVWYSELMFPLSSIDPRPPKSGNTFRVNFYRVQHVGGRAVVPIAWSPTGTNSNFSVPSVFGTLVLK